MVFVGVAPISQILPVVKRRLRISGPPVVAVMSRRVGSFGNPKGSRAPSAIAKDFGRLVSTESWSRLSEQNLRFDKWSLCRV
jgi:hypothetical protein